MDYSRYITPDTILIDVDAGSRSGLLGQVVTALLQAPLIRVQRHVNGDRIWEAIANRGGNAGYVAGHQAAVPLARIKNFRGLGLCVAIPRTPIVWEEGQPPVNLVVLAVVPESRPTLAVKVQARIERLVQDPAVRALFATEKSAEALCAWLRANAFEVEIPLTAADLMRDPIALLGPETPLVEITRRMVEWNLDAVGIVDRDQRLVGEIRADALFTLGMPDFFSQLKSVSFIAEYDPFEKYFQHERERLAKDVMDRNFALVKEDATVLEIVFLLAVQHHAKVYVERNGKMVGVIDRIRVIDRILNI